MFKEPVKRYFVNVIVDGEHQIASFSEEQMIQLYELAKKPRKTVLRKVLDFLRKICILPTTMKKILSLATSIGLLASANAMDFKFSDVDIKFNDKPVIDLNDWNWAPTQSSVNVGQFIPTTFPFPMYHKPNHEPIMYHWRRPKLSDGGPCRPPTHSVPDGGTTFASLLIGLGVLVGIRKKY